MSEWKVVEEAPSESWRVVEDSPNIGKDLLNDFPYLALSAAQTIPGPVGSAIDAASSAAEHPFAFMMGGPSVNKMQEGANLAGLLKTLVGADKSSVKSFLKDLGKNEEIFPSTGITSAKSGVGQLAQLGIGIVSPSLQKKFSNLDPVANAVNNPKLGPGIPEEKQVSSAIDSISSNSDQLSKFYKTSNNYGADVIDNLATSKIAEIDPKISKADEVLSQRSYELSKKFRDDYYPKYSQKISEDFSKAWDGVVGGVEVDAPDITKAFSDFGRSSGIYNKAQYSPETLLPIEKKILNYMNGVSERIGSESVSRMKLEDLSSGFEDILRGEYGKQWKTPILDRFRKSFIDLAGDSKYSEMKAVKAEFKPKYQFREDMRPFFGKKKGEANMQPSVNLFKNWASGDLQTKNPSHAEIIKKITKEFGDTSLDAISSVAKDKSDLLASRQAIISQAEADKNILTSRIMGKVANTVSDKNAHIDILSKLLGDVQDRKSNGILSKLSKYAIDKVLPGSKEVSLLRDLKKS